MADADNVIRAFGPDHVIILTGLSKTQLRYWDQIGFFRPKYAAEDRSAPYSRIYSFKDVVGLRTLAILRKEHMVSLQHLRWVAKTLSNYDQSLWSEIKLFVLGRRVYFKGPTEDTAINVDGQLALIILLKDVIDDIEHKTKQLRERAPDQYGKIDRHRLVLRNAWVVSGTRIPTGAIKDFHDAGYSINQIKGLSL